MEQPPLDTAPLEWLEAVVGDLTQKTDNFAVDITITSSEDGSDYKFEYRLGDLRTELHKRTTN